MVWQSREGAGFGGRQRSSFNTSLSLSHPKDAQINTGFPVSTASQIQVGNRKTIPGEDQIHTNAARNQSWQPQKLISLKTNLETT